MFKTKVIRGSHWIFVSFYVGERFLANFCLKPDEYEKFVEGLDGNEKEIKYPN